MTFNLINSNLNKALAYLALVLIFSGCADNYKVQPDPLPDNIQSLEKLLDNGLTGDTKLQAYYMLYGRYLNKDNDKAEWYIDELLKLAKEENSQPYIARAKHGKGYLKQIKGNYLDALPPLLHAVDMFEEIGDATRMADDINNIGLVFLKVEGYKEAIPYFEKASIIYGEIGDHEYKNYAYTNLAICYSRTNSYVKAKDYLNEVISLLPKGHAQIAYYYNELALVYYHSKDYSQSIELYKKALEYSRTTEDKYVTHYGIANVYISINDAEKAEEWLRQAPSINSENLQERHIVKGRNVYGTLFQLKNNHSKAVECFEQAINIADKNIINEPLNSTLDLLSQSYRKLTANGAKVAYDDIYRIADLKKQQQELKDSFYNGMNAKALQTALNSEVEVYNQRKLQAGVEAQQWTVFRYGIAIIVCLLVFMWVLTKQKHKWALASKEWQAKSESLKYKCNDLEFENGDLKTKDLRLAELRSEFTEIYHMIKEAVSESEKGKEELKKYDHLFKDDDSQPAKD